MKVLHLLTSGSPGGIESLCKNIALKSDFDNRFCFIFYEGIIYEELVKNNAKVISLKMKKYQLISIIKEITNYCKEEKINIINMHHGGMYCNIIYILLKKYNPKIKFVRFLHGCYDKYTYGNSDNKINNFIIKKVMNKALKISDLIVSVSNAVEETFEQKFNIKDKNKVVIYNGIGNEFFEKELPKRKSLKNRELRIIFVGRLVNVKGVDILIEAVSKLIREKYKMNLTIVGDGVERKKLEQLAKKLEIDSKVNFVGSQSNVIKWLDESDVFIYPSIWEEAFGISVVEAMARGCVPIVFNKGGLIEIIENGKDGFIVEQISSKSLANKIKEAIKILGLDENIRERAIYKAKKFTIDDTIKKLKEEYNKMLEE